MNLERVKMGNINAKDLTTAIAIKSTVKSLIDTSFSATLGREPDIVNVVNAQILHESGYYVNAVGYVVSSRPGTGGAGYLNSSAVANVLKTGTADQIKNIIFGLKGIGLMQVMGWCFVKGGSPNGVCELQRLRPELSGPLVVNPGEDLTTAILGHTNISNAILAGLIILEAKYKSTWQKGAFWQVNGDTYERQFSSKLAAAVGAYLGLGRADTFGTTPEEYASSVVGGKIYQKANGPNPIYVASNKPNIVSTNGPGTPPGTITYSPIVPPGC
jgi:hypothetical protein